MSERTPTHFLLVPGPWTSDEEVVAIVQSAGLPTTSVGSTEAGMVGIALVQDDDLRSAFSSDGPALLDAQELKAVSRCTRAALVELGWLLHEDSKRTARVGRALRDAGGAAVRMEGSGNASGFEQWLTRLESGRPFDLCAAAIVVVGDDDGLAFSCGMHQFDLPDVEVDLQPLEDATTWIQALCVFMLAEAPLLGSGHTFRPHQGVAQRRLERWPDQWHAPSDGRYNPFGLWRLVDDDEEAVQPSQPVLTIIPPLTAMLLNAERRKGTHLTQDEVIRIRDSAPAIAMDLAQATAVERSRGYADLEPLRVWEQWQLVREVL